MDSYSYYLGPGPLKFKLKRMPSAAFVSWWFAPRTRLNLLWASSTIDIAFHPQAFTAQCGASLVESRKGRDALLKYVDACFEHQETYMNAALGDARKSDVDAVFATIAEKAGVLDASFTKEAFLSSLHDWESAVKPAYAEHKIALGYGVYGTPKHVIDGELVPDTESAWGAADWAEKLKSL